MVLVFGLGPRAAVSDTASLARSEDILYHWNQLPLSRSEEVASSQPQTHIIPFLEDVNTLDKTSFEADSLTTQDVYRNRQCTAGEGSSGFR